MIDYKEFCEKINSNERLSSALFGLPDGEYKEKITKEEYEEQKEKSYFEDNENPMIVEYEIIDKEGKHEEKDFEYYIFRYSGSYAIQRAYLGIFYAKRRLKFFEKGKAPLSIIEHFKKEIAFYKDCIDKIVSKLDCGETKNEK